MELYLKVGNKLVKVDRMENGIPIINTESEETINPDGTVDCTIKVPCLRISAQMKQPNSKEK